jgi:hypothetical protein
MHPIEIISLAPYKARSTYCQTFLFTSRPPMFDLVIFVKLVFLLDQNGLAFLHRVDQKGFV